VSRLGFRSAVTTRPDPIINPKMNSIPRLGIEHYLSSTSLGAKLSGWEHLARRIIGNL